MGGNAINQRSTFSDILIFDTNTKTVTTEVEEGNLEFNALENQCARIAPNHIVAKVSGKDGKQAIISYKLGEQKVNILKQWN